MQKERRQLRKDYTIIVMQHKEHYDHCNYPRFYRIRNGRRIQPAMLDEPLGINLGQSYL